MLPLLALAFLPLAYGLGRLAAAMRLGPLLLAPVLFAGEETVQHTWPFVMAYVVSIYYAAPDLTDDNTGDPDINSLAPDMLPGFEPFYIFGLALGTAFLLHFSSPVILTIIALAAVVCVPGMRAEILVPTGLMLVLRWFGTSHVDLVPSALAAMFVSSGLRLTPRQSTDKPSTTLAWPLFFVGTFFSGVTAGTLARVHFHLTGEDAPLDLSAQERIYELASAILIVVTDQTIGKTLLGSAVVFTANLHAPILITLGGLALLHLHCKVPDWKLPELPFLRLLFIFTLPSPAIPAAIAFFALIKIYPTARAWLFPAFFISRVLT